MKWYEYQMEVDSLHTSEDLKAKLLAMQPAAAEPPRKKAVHFPAKQVLGLAACFAVGILCSNLWGTSVLRNKSAVSEATAASTSAGAALYSMQNAAVEMDNGLRAVDLSGDADLTADTAQAARQKSSTQTAKIIYTADLSLESKDYDAARAALDAALAEAGGYLESSSEYVGTARSLSLTLRVPEENYRSFLEAAAGAGNLVRRNEQAEDVTTQYLDVEARLANLEAQRARLQQLQAQAENLSDLLEIESSLNDVQYQIESWQNQLNWYEQQVSCCTVYLSLSEVQEYTPAQTGFAARIGYAFANGWAAFVAGAQQLAVWLVQAWPLVVLLCAAVAGVVLYRRRAGRK